MKIIFKNEDNSIGIITPTDEAIFLASGNVYDNRLTSEDNILKVSKEWDNCVKISMPIIAEKDVPHNLPYWIVEDSEIPEDRTFRDCWEIDESLGEPDGFGGLSNEFDAELLAKYQGEINDKN
jgi:hypothetical protein